MWFWMNDYLMAPFEYPLKRCSYSTVWLLHGLCYMKLLPYRHMFCAHRTTMHQFTVQLHLKPHAYVHLCFTVTCYLHFQQNDEDLLHATAVWCLCMYVFVSSLCRGWFCGLTWERVYILIIMRAFEIAYDWVWLSGGDCVADRTLKSNY